METTLTVNFYANLRPIVGSRTMEYRLMNGTTVRQLIAEIVQRHPGLDPVLLDSAGELYRHVHVFINGRDAPYLKNALDAVLTPGDTVDVLPATAGG